jgi:hypothetical protein
MEVSNDHFVDVLNFGILHLEFMPEDFNCFLGKEESVCWLVDPVSIVSEHFVQDHVGDGVFFSLALQADLIWVV